MCRVNILVRMVSFSKKYEFHAYVFQKFSFPQDIEGAHLLAKFEDYFLGTSFSMFLNFHPRPRSIQALLESFAKGLSGPVLRDTARLSQRYPPIARYGSLIGVST